MSGRRTSAAKALRVACLGAVTAGLVPRGTASAEPGAPVRLRYEAPAGCPDEAAFRAAIAARAPVSFAEGVAGAHRTDVHVRVDPKQGEPASPSRLLYEGSLSVTPPTPPVSRELAAETCRAVTDALALAVALAVDPRAGAAPRGSSSDDREPANEWYAGLGLRGGLGRPGPAVAVSWRAAAGGAWRLAPAVTLLAARGGAITSGDAQAQLALALVRPEVCLARAWEGISWRAACLGAEVGAVTAAGRGIESARRETRGHGAAAASSRLSLPLGSTWLVELAVELALPVTRHRYIFERPIVPIYRVPAVAAGGAVALGARWP